MKKSAYPKLLSLTLVSAMLIFVSYKSGDEPVKQANKNKSETAARPKGKSAVSSQYPVKAVSFRVVNKRQYESGFIGWNIYAVVRNTDSSGNGDGC